MELLEDKRHLIVKLEAGEPVLGSLLTVARGHGLKGAVLSGIGAVGHARLGFFLPEEKRYETRDFHENLEVLSLSGNLAQSEAGPVIHAHVALGRADFSVIGGHLFEATVSVTLEVFLSQVAARIERRHDPRFDLKLLRLR
jgi:predicted DNA-binding protein with PD1-like motif